MKVFKILRNQKGGIAKILLALLIVIFVAIMIAYLVIRSAEKPVKIPVTDPETTTVPKAVYEQTINDIKITFQEAVNMGSTLWGSNANNPKYQKNLETTEKFIIVTIGAQNKGKADTERGVWDLGNVIDSEGRNFIPNNYSANPWIPETSSCKDILKPEFTPTPCTKIYEVAKGSDGLKVQVVVNKKDSEGKYDSGKEDIILLDLIVNKK